VGRNTVTQLILFNPSYFRELGLLLEPSTENKNVWDNGAGFYRLSVLPASQPTESKHLRELKALTRPEDLNHWLHHFLVHQLAL